MPHKIRKIATSLLARIRAFEWKRLPTWCYIAAGTVLLLLVLPFGCSATISSDEAFVAFYDSRVRPMKELCKEDWRRCKEDRAKVLRELCGDAPVVYSLEFAVSMGSLPAVRYLVEEKGAQLRDAHLCHAAIAGQLEMVEYLIDRQGLRADAAALAAACLGGHLGICEYLVEEQGIDATRGSCLGSLLVDRASYARLVAQLGCINGDDVTVDELQERHVAVAEFLVEHGADASDKVLQSRLDQADNPALTAFLRQAAR